MILFLNVSEEEKQTHTHTVTWTNNQQNDWHKYGKTLKIFFQKSRNTIETLFSFILHYFVFVIKMQPNKKLKHTFENKRPRNTIIKISL